VKKTTTAILDMMKITIVMTTVMTITIKNMIIITVIKIKNIFAVTLVTAMIEMMTILKTKKIVATKKEVAVANGKMKTTVMTKNKIHVNTKNVVFGVALKDFTFN